MNKAFMLTCAIVFGALFSSCKKTCEENTVPSFNRTEIYNCNKAQNFDSARLAKALTGVWKWQWTQTELGQQKADREMLYTLKSDGSFLIITDGVVSSQGSWMLKPVDGLFGIETEPAGYYPGRVELCDRQLFINDGYRDGAEMLFYKSN